MNFNELHELIPYATGKKNHVLEFSPYNAVEIRLPGRHQQDTVPPGGDFLITIDDDALGWTSHQFTHDDLFKDFERRRESKYQVDKNFLNRYYDVIVEGTDPGKWSMSRSKHEGLIHPQILITALQVLGVCEHRRYHQHEPRGGGRFLPLRFSAGIFEGKWNASDAISLQRRGRIGAEILEKAHGMPDATTRLKASIKANKEKK